MSLADKLVAFWEFEEEADTRYDSHIHRYDLTDITAVARETGKVRYAASFARSSSQRLFISHLAAPLLNFQSESFYVCAWVYRTTSGEDTYICHKGGRFSDNILYSLAVDENNQPWFQVRGYDLNGADLPCASVWGSAISLNTWYFVEGWWDWSTRTAYIDVNQSGSPVTFTNMNMTSMKQVSNAFVVASEDATDGEPKYWDGLIDQLAIFTPLPTTTERATLFNSGAGVSYTDILSCADCGTIVYGNFTFPSTFYPADDNLDWMIPSIKAGRRHGGHSLSATLREKRLTVRGGLIEGPIGGVAVLRDELDTIRDALGQQPRNLSYECDRYWRNVRVEMFRNPYGPTHYCRIADGIEILFVTDDPFQYSASEDSDTWSALTTGDTHTITVGGNAPAQPTFEITVGGAGSQSIDYTLENVRTGESFTLSGTVTGGQTITVNTLAQTVTIGSTDEMDLFDGQFPQFDGAADNTLQVTIASGSIISIVTTWRNRWY